MEIWVGVATVGGFVLALLGVLVVVVSRLVSVEKDIGFLKKQQKSDARYVEGMNEWISGYLIGISKQVQRNKDRTEKIIGQCRLNTDDWGDEEQEPDVRLPFPRRRNGTDDGTETEEY